jgi:hypothetical protein
VDKKPHWLKPLTHVIAERQYRLVTRGRRRQKVVLRVGRPYRSATDGLYWCGYQIDGLDECAAKTAKYLNGDDSIGALCFALYMAMTDLLWTDAYEEGRLTYGGFYDLGLPVSNQADRDRIRKDPRAERMKAKVRLLLADDLADEELAQAEFAGPHRKRGSRSRPKTKGSTTRSRRR